jgi:phage gpG-like protein
MEKIELTDEQKQFIDKNYKKINNLNELTNAVFMGEDLDGRTKEGRAVRQYMAAKDYKYNTRDHKKVPPVNLTEEHKEFIMANADGKMKAFDMAKILFSEKEISPLSKETIVITEFLKKQAPEKIHPKESAVGERYKPVRNFKEALQLVNNATNQELEDGKMQAQIKKGIEALIGFMQAPRLVQTIGNYTNKADRALFEAEFVRATWDKPDLTSDEVNLYINVCIDYINLMNIQKAVDKLNHMFEECEDQRDMTVRLAELLKTKSEEYNQCEKRMESLITRLNGDRAKRVQNKQSQNASILNLVQLFQEEEEREVMIKIAEMQKQLVEEEISNLESMPDWKARVLGLRKGDVA